MNQKKAKRLRKAAKQISQDEAPDKVYRRLENLESKLKKGTSTVYLDPRCMRGILKDIKRRMKGTLG